MNLSMAAMYMDSKRRHFFLRICGTLAAIKADDTFATHPTFNIPKESRQNFRAIYKDARSRAEFRNFLVNVFNLYPEEKLHQLISHVAMQNPDDRGAYLAGQSALPRISPMLRELRYELPALNKQKEVLATQTVQLLGERRRFDGYLEIGSTGRYLDLLGDRLTVTGSIYTIAEQAPDYSIVDILDRGQLSKAGKFIQLGHYDPDIFRAIPQASLELVTVYIGFHHCPIPLRADFFAAIRDVMKPGAAMIVRDHEVNSRMMWHTVALAHDVFNMGTSISWTTNQRELRNFYSLDELDGMLYKAGFRSDGRRLLQKGDPTHNTLMLYQKA